MIPALNQVIAFHRLNKDQPITRTNLRPLNLPMVGIIVNKLILIFCEDIFYDSHRWQKLLHWNCVRLVCIDTKVANCNLLAVRRHENPCIELHEGEKCEKDRTKQAEKAAKAGPITLAASVM